MYWFYSPRELTNASITHKRTLREQAMTVSHSLCGDANKTLWNSQSC